MTFTFSSIDQIWSRVRSIGCGLSWETRRHTARDLDSNVEIA
jgi:hypothetical protein